mgnify:FL=1|tara:strand:- start:1913 stop:2338 length:426 start_codon:yes stop_codon:yes gene_type:complete
MAYNKPIPVPQGESDVYWQKAKQGELWLRYCNSCNEAYFFPTDICRAIPCDNPRDTKWIKASGKATLFTFAIVGYETGRAPHPGFEAPYVTAIVELEEGPKMPTNIVIEDPSPDNLQIGMELEVVFEDITDEIALPKFKPV